MFFKLVSFGLFPIRFCPIRINVAYLFPITQRRSSIGKVKHPAVSAPVLAIFHCRFTHLGFIRFAIVALINISWV
jgi:hypothetical protein